MTLREVCHLSYATDCRDGGIATAVSGLVQAQQEAGLPAVWTTADQLDHVEALNPQSSVLHLHGLWRRPTRRANRWHAAGFHAVIAPHGMLDPWAFANSRLQKQLVWGLWERRALQGARCLHALCQAEADAIRHLLPDRPIAVIPNGITIPETQPSQPALPPPWSGAIPEEAKVLLFLGRFHPKKGLTPLITAWHMVAEQARRSGWWLALVGYGDGGRLEQQLAAEPIPQVMAFGPVFGAAKEASLAAASAFVLPSHSEGLPMAALEAMAHQLPTLLSSACNLPNAFETGAAIDAEPDPIALQHSLQRLFGLEAEQRAAMGRCGHQLVNERYRWPAVVAQTQQLYSWLLGGGDRPGFVQI